MFSKTTIASSTKIPTTIERATRLIRFSVKPKKYIPIKAAISEVGIETITISALRKLCRKKYITTATNTIAKTRSNITEFAACRVNSLVSSASCSFTFSFLYVFSICAILVRTCSLTDTALASVCLSTCSKRVFSWLIRAILSASSSASCTSATSERRISIPFLEASVRFRNCSIS